MSERTATPSCSLTRSISIQPSAVADVKRPSNVRRKVDCVIANPANVYLDGAPKLPSYSMSHQPFVSSNTRHQLSGARVARERARGTRIVGLERIGVALGSGLRLKSFAAGCGADEPRDFEVRAIAKP